MTNELGSITEVYVDHDENEVYVDVSLAPRRDAREIKFLTGGQGLWAVPEKGDYVSVRTLSDGSRVAHTVHNEPGFELPDGLSEGDVAIQSGSNSYIHVRKDGTIHRSDDNVVTVSKEEDLPDPENGVRSLESMKAYKIEGFIETEDTIELGTLTPLLGNHGGNSGIIYKGGGTAITNTNSVFMRNLSVSAPGGTIFDISGSTAAEVLIESCSFADFSMEGNIASLGTFDGMRVPSFKGCNFEDFDDGLTFTGNPDKIFFSTTPFRTVTASGVTILDFDANLTTDIVDITDCFVKGVQSDTVVVDVDPSATISEIFQYRGTTHDPSVTQSNILTGQAGLKEAGFRVVSSFPLADSSVGGTIDYDGAGTATTIAGSGAGWEQVDVSTTLQAPERLSNPSNGVLQYDARFDKDIRIFATISVSGSNTQFAVGVGPAGAGSPANRTVSRAYASNSTDAETVTIIGRFQSVTTGDQYALYLENIGGTADLDVENMTISV